MGVKRRSRALIRWRSVTIRIVHWVTVVWIASSASPKGLVRTTFSHQGLNFQFVLKQIKTLTQIKIMFFDMELHSLCKDTGNVLTYLFELSLLLIHAMFKRLVLRHKHLKSLFIPILNGLHLHTQVFNCLVEILYHTGKLWVLLDQLFNLIWVQIATLGRGLRVTDG